MHIYIYIHTLNMISRLLSVCTLLLSLQIGKTIECKEACRLLGNNTYRHGKLMSAILSIVLHKVLARR